jgi:D-proline reductase (dithiol) PrdB
MEHLQTHPSFLSYINRTREFYAAQGYPKAYEWPRYDEVPFAPLGTPLSECRVGLVTTAGKMPAEGTLNAMMMIKLRELYAESSNPPPKRLLTEDLGWHKEATHTGDLDSYLPINRMNEFVAQGRVGSLSPRYYGVPTDYSQRRTLEQYAPQVLKWCREDHVDAVALIAL